MPKIIMNYYSMGLIMEYFFSIFNRFSKDVVLNKMNKLIDMLY